VPPFAEHNAPTLVVEPAVPEDDVAPAPPPPPPPVQNTSMELIPEGFVQVPLAVKTCTLVNPPAGKPVKLAPLIAGKAPVNFEAVKVEIRASATVPVKFADDKLVNEAPLIAGKAPVRFAADKLVNPLPSPTNGLFNVIFPVPVLVSKLSTFIVLIELPRSYQLAVSLCSQN
jgi:hypothetical protein